MRSVLRSVFRLFPGCATQAQAVAYNMFLAFFPMLLLGLGVLTSTVRLRAGLQEIVVRLREVLPPGTHQVVANFLMPQGIHPWRWILVGSGGTLLAGTQVMRLLMDGFHMTYGDPKRPPFWSRQARALLLLIATFVPWLAIVFLTVFGKQIRNWMIRHFGLPTLFRWLGGVLFSAVALTMAILVLAAVYRVGRPGVRGWREVLPGAGTATVLWWGANLAFGVYVRHMPYGLVSGGLAAFIGLMLWMQLTALIVLFGAALNAELAAGGDT